MVAMKSVIDQTSAKQRWEREVLEPTLKKSPERKGPFTTISGRRIERLYAPEDVQNLDYAREVGQPGEFPYVRGIHPTGSHFQVIHAASAATSSRETSGWKRIPPFAGPSVMLYCTR